MKIGLLLPSSSFYPYMGVDFQHACRRALESDIEIINEETNFASPKEIQVATKNLIVKENVDIVTGWIGYKVITAIRPIIQQTQTPLIMCNAGESPLLKADKSPFIVHCSLNLFNATYLAFKWALNHFGSQYCSLLSFYNAGYPFSYAAKLAADKYNGRIEGIEVSHKEKNPDLKSYIDRLKEKSPAFIFSAYSGWEAVDLMRVLKENPQLLNIPIVANSMLTDDQVLKQSGVENIYSVNTWMNHDNEIYTNLEKYFKEELHRNVSLFGILGYEAGMLIKHLLDNNWEPKTELTGSVENIALSTPRGKLSFNSDLNNFESDYFLYRTETANSDGKISNSILEKLSPDQEDRDILSSVDKELSGWLNTYLCV